MIYAEKRRDIEACVATRSPSGSGPDDKAVVGSAADTFVSKAPEQTFDSHLQLFPRSLGPGHRLDVLASNIFVIRSWRRRCMKKMNRRDDTLRNAPFATAVAFDFLLKKAIQGPLDAVEK